MKLSFTEENYLKAIYHLSEVSEEGVSTNAIAEELNIELGGHHSVRNMVNAIHKKLLEHYATGYRTYLLIDEAQNLIHTKDSINAIKYFEKFYL